MGCASRQEHLAKKEQQGQKKTEYLKWKERSADVRFKYGLPAQSFGWTGRPGVRLRGLACTARQVDVINVCFARACQLEPVKPVSEIVRGLFCNPGQGVDRLPLSRGPATYGSNLEQYSFEVDAVLSAGANLRSAGWPRHVMPLELYSEADLQSLAGDCFQSQLPRL